ncbi:MAG: allophanate hydrolase [Methylobacteriaceae bacterium]|nr:allophanate hydrolase [Methylobacteriaceae bacterium]
MSLETEPVTLAEMLDAHRSGESTPHQTIARTYARIRAYDDPALFITLRTEDDALTEADALEAKGARDLPLYGIPVAIKDNIDVAGLPTTAACPAFAYEPKQDATVVARLRAAGAIVIGKTNLDQFATGLVGTRSPYGVPRNALRDDLIPGGSSSGSAAAVAAGLVPISLGTDTAGSGRVPAMLNNIVGLKPSLGLISMAGVVPACRTLDCVSIFSLDVAGAWSVLGVVAAFDTADPFSRRMPIASPDASFKGIRLGVLAPADRSFFGDTGTVGAYEIALARARDLGAALVEFDFAPFAETARLLYEGPWVAERWNVIEELARRDPDAIHPITRAIIEPGASLSAVETFRAFYRLAELRAKVQPIWTKIDALLLPTAPSVYERAQVEADNIHLNSRLGTYTNFVNLLDLCGLAVPAVIAADGKPYGVTFLAPCGRDAFVAGLGQAFGAASRLPLGAGKKLVASRPWLAEPPTKDADVIEVALFGAHMQGLPLNRDVIALGGKYVRTVATGASYRCFLLPGTVPRPGVLRVGKEGTSIEAEIWSMPPDGFGRFVASIPPPLGFGTIILSDGSQVKGFLVEAHATIGARDISSFGGWRAYLAESAAA